MTSFSAGGQGMGSEEGVVHHGEMQSVKEDSMCCYLCCYLCSNVM